MHDLFCSLKYTYAMEVYSNLSVGIIFMIIFYIIKRPRIGKNEPPLVPYTIPILGHTYNYLFNTKSFIKKCKEQYGECFSLYVFGRVVTVVSRNFMNQVLKNHDDFENASAIREVWPLHQIFINGGISSESMKFHAKTTRDQITGKLDVNVPIMQKYILKGIDKWIGDCSEPKIFYNAWLMINNIVALPITNIFTGEEASHEDVVKSLGDLAFDMGPLMATPPIFTFIHQKLNEFIVTLPMKFGWNPVLHNRKVVMNHVKPVIDKRLREKNVLGDNYKPYNDLLEYYMNQPDFDLTNPNKLPYYVDNLFLMGFLAIVTTSRATANALYDLAGRPEFFDELYEEALVIDKECHGSLTVSDIQKMKKLDSFIKESFRHTNDIISTPHYVISKSFTFFNGYTIPNRRLVTLYLDDSLKSKESFGDDAEDFKPFQFVNTNSSATKVDRSYVVFGGGKHACPGRFFAVVETKLILHKLILKYHISTKSGHLEDKVVNGPVTLPPRSALVFKNRK